MQVRYLEQRLHIFLPAKPSPQVIIHYRDLVPMGGKMHGSGPTQVTIKY